jgi:hypothetical protein
MAKKVKIDGIVIEETIKRLENFREQLIKYSDLMIPNAGVCPALIGDDDDNYNRYNCSGFECGSLNCYIARINVAIAEIDKDGNKAEIRAINTTPPT